MKKYFIVALTIGIFVSCKETKTESNTEEIAETQVSYATFGDSISQDNAISAEEMLAKFENMKEGDTIDVKFKSSINDICQKKGCWMSLDLGNEEETFVKFKDYEFFVPKNAQEHEAIVNGKAYVSVISVNDLKHYAKDEGKSQEAIDSITEPEVTYSFMADGVLIADKK